MMKIRKLCKGMSLTDSVKYAYKSATKKGFLGSLLFTGGVIGFCMLLDAIEEKAYAVGMDDANRPHDMLLSRLHDKYNLKWKDVIAAADEINAEAGLPPTNTEWEEVKRF